MVLTVFPRVMRQGIERRIALSFIFEAYPTGRQMTISKFHIAAKYFVFCQCLAHFRTVFGRQAFESFPISLNGILSQLASNGDVLLGKLAK